MQVPTTRRVGLDNSLKVCRELWKASHTWSGFSWRIRVGGVVPECRASLPPPRSHPLRPVLAHLEPPLTTGLGRQSGPADA